MTKKFLMGAVAVVFLGGAFGTPTSLQAQPLPGDLPVEALTPIPTPIPCSDEGNGLSPSSSPSKGKHCKAVSDNPVPGGSPPEMAPPNTPDDYTPGMRDPNPDEPWNPPDTRPSSLPPLGQDSPSLPIYEEGSPGNPGQNELPPAP